MAFYTTKTTIMNDLILVESLMGNEQKISVVNRGPQENRDLAQVIVQHKQQADVILSTSTPQQLLQRQGFDNKAEAAVTAALP